jgi:hypothetical protein
MLLASLGIVGGMMIMVLLLMTPVVMIHYWVSLSWKMMQYRVWQVYPMLID